jgi:hypothetical protein
MSVFLQIKKDGGGIQFDVASSLNFKMIREIVTVAAGRNFV